MQLLHDPPALCQRVSLSHLAAQAFRVADDIEPRHALMIARNLGGDPNVILEAGYRLVTGAFLATFRRHDIELPDFVTSRKTIILPCLNERGEIVAIHDEKGQWLLGSASHVSNPKRARYSPVRIGRTTSEADTLALAQNVCVVVAHGIPILDLLERVSGEKARVAA